MNKSVGLKKVNFRFISVIVIVGLFVINGVVITFYSVTMSDKQSNLNTKIEQLTEENRRLSNALYSITSLQKVYEKSSNMGYKSADEILYISNEKPVAELR